MTEWKKSNPVIRSQSISQRHFRRDDIRRNFSIEGHIEDELLSKMNTSRTDTLTATSSPGSPDANIAASSTQLSHSVSQRSLHKTHLSWKDDIVPIPKSSPQMSSEPALLDVRNKVQRFETMRAEDRIIFKTGTRIKPPIPLPNPKPITNPRPISIPKPLPNPKPRPKSNLKSVVNLEPTANYNPEPDQMANPKPRPMPNPKPMSNIKPVENCKPEPDRIPNPKPRPMPNPKPVRKHSNIATSTLSNKTLNGSSAKTMANILEDDGFVEPILRRKETFVWRVPTRPAFEEAANNEESTDDDFSSSDIEDDNVEAVKTWESWKTLMAILKCRKDNEYLINEMLNTKYEKSIQHIINELITTEETYVDNLCNGIANYANICEREDTPIGLRSKKSILFGNIEQITTFHRDTFLPLLRRNRRSPKRLFDEFYSLINDNRFYGYVVYAMNQQRSLELYQVHQDYFKLVQSELNDKLGINSFLLQPIQRMPRYQLLVQNISTLDNRQINSYGDYFKLYDGHHHTQDDLCILLKEIQLMFNSSIRLEKKVQKLLTTINESHEINDIVDVNVLKFQGKFHKADEFTVSSHPLRFSYRSKVFLFDKNIIYTKIKGHQLFFKGCFPCDSVGFFNQSKSFTLFSGSRRSSDPQECRFSGEPLLVQEWCDLISEIQEQHRKTPSHDSGIFSSDSSSSSPPPPPPPLPSM